MAHTYRPHHHQYTILLTQLLALAIKYSIHTIDLRSEAPWEGKSMYIFYTELIVGASPPSLSHARPTPKAKDGICRPAQAHHVSYVFCPGGALLRPTPTHNPRLVPDAPLLPPTLQGPHPIPQSYRKYE